MESSKKYEEAEECHSSESGWTMYIGSPLNGGDDNDDLNHDDVDKDGEENDNISHPADDSDDSMASDASSGPSHAMPFDVSAESGGGPAHCKYQKKKHYSSCYKREILVKNSHKNRNEVKEESSFKARGAKVAAQNVNKERPLDGSKKVNSTSY